GHVGGPSHHSPAPAAAGVDNRPDGETTIVHGQFAAVEDRCAGPRAEKNIGCTASVDHRVAGDPAQDALVAPRIDGRTHAVTALDVDDPAAVDSGAAGDARRVDRLLAEEI